ncbi:MAG: cytochrome c3 family protein, partial [bacterium]
MNSKSHEGRVFPVSDRGWRSLCFGLMLGMATGVVGCASDARDKWLRVFFDGVPSRSEAVVPVNVVSNAAPVRVQPVVVAEHIHAPFGSRECTGCHESKFSQKLSAPVPGLCFGCHDDFLKGSKVKHSPAENGECLGCHSPHKSKFVFLLNREGKALCVECHDDPGKDMNSRHDPVEKGKCTACHDPHGSANKN